MTALAKASFARLSQSAGGFGEAERQRAGWVLGVKGPKGGANPPRVPIMTIAPYCCIS
jgi:hypothetical protein